MKNLIILFFLTACLSGLLLGCTPAQKAEETAFIETEEATPSALPQPTAITVPPTPTVLPYIVPPIDFSTDAIFCADEPDGSDFLTTCSKNGLLVSQSPNRRKTDSLLRREFTTATDGFSLSASITSQPADMDRLDQNQFGFYFTSTSGKTFAVRVSGQYFNFEEWESTHTVKVADAYNSTYAPALSSAGRKNEIQLICDFGRCDLYSNGVLIGRSPYETQGTIITVGFFTASNWDQTFGDILLESFFVEEVSTKKPSSLIFNLNDTLTQNTGTFSQMGLSGAFSDFEADGFHFSPVIPYGYYAAKAGPSLADVSVSAVVNMEYTPGIPGTQYAGVVCRSSFDGRYLAVLRVDGTFTIYRDTLRYPFQLLAKGPIVDIQAGRSANTIRLDCIHNSISLYINETHVTTLEDDRYGIRFGRAGLITKAGGAPYSDAIIFSDFMLAEAR
jgi:hypothetical protein